MDILIAIDGLEHSIASSHINHAHKDVKHMF